MCRQSPGILPRPSLYHFRIGEGLAVSQTGGVLAGGNEKRPRGRRRRRPCFTWMLSARRIRLNPQCSANPLGLSVVAARPVIELAHHVQVVVVDVDHFLALLDMWCTGTANRRE